MQTAWTVDSVFAAICACNSVDIGIQQANALSIAYAWQFDLEPSIT